ncbi:AAA family ATPase [Spirosoma sp.]|uniref:AAA family ATPase n=1 Tax=Spirosoma sp. TaxID=1899569 RepID=UPI002621C897|nr:AAA family ATPase [Spirosoma sp.]MCX6219090.1 AAA family ATPase [Spirosoma sp.]
MPFLLQSFRVTNFRSIVDSGEIRINDCTCLVGTNESGKTNLLIALQKLNPSNGELIVPLTDYPRKQYVTFDTNSGKEPFIRATFRLDEAITAQMVAKLGYTKELVTVVEVARYYNGRYDVNFPDSFLGQYPNKYIHALLSAFYDQYLTSDLITRDKEEITQDLREFIERLVALLPESGSVGEYDVYNLISQLDEFITVKYSRRQTFRLFVDEQLKTPLENIARLLTNKRIVLTPEQQRFLIDQLPRFVYYTDYGNLDAEIYLPHVIQNSSRQDLGFKERAKVRTLKVLFDFVQLKPEEILELGSEISQTKVITRDSYGRIDSTVVETALENTVDQERENKKKREVILQAASARLTKAFQEWWRQGNYRFRFQADGNHFRIWVSDEKRTEEIELDGRSKGLQWFFSFFLTFRAEQANGHSNCILLLDEPGLSLHPIAQQDLLTFLHSLSPNNQLIYTTHSPFLIGSQELSNLKMLYVGSDGNSVISDDYRTTVHEAEESFYPIRAALNLRASEQLLTSCLPVLVNDVASQIYLQLIKSYLLQTGAHPATKDLLFIPVGGAEGVEPLTRMLAQQVGTLPYVLLDGTVTGHALANSLIQASYSGSPSHVITLSGCKTDERVLEDLLPATDLARHFSRMYRGQQTDDFDYILLPNQSIVRQMEQFALDNGYTLTPDWRLTLAGQVAKTFDKLTARLQPETIQGWIALFNRLA